MSKILNSPFYSNKLHQTGKTVYSTPDHIYTIVDYNYSYEPTFSASLYHKTIDQIYPIRTKYLYSSVKLESFENIDANQKDSYPIKYELLYRSNDRYIKIEEAVSENGKASFTNLIKGYTYYIKAIDTSGKYQSKMVQYIPTEYDNTQEPQLLVSYKDLSYEKFQYYFLTVNALGDKYVYLENNNDHIKLEKLDDKRYKISLTEVKNRADEFDLVYEDHRDNDIIKKVDRIYINDGFSIPYNISIEFTDTNAAIFRWNTDGQSFINKVYISDNIINKGIPVDVIGTSTYIITNYDISKTQYLWLSSLREGKEKFSDPITIDAFDKSINPLVGPSVNYSINQNNDLLVYLNHNSTTVDNYSVYLEENEITSIDTLTPIAKNTTNKSLVLPNFDVYNNYGKTLKLVATTNKYNHQYLSDNKDVYVAYDWAPEQLSNNLKIFLDVNDITTDTITNWQCKITNANFSKSGTGTITINDYNGLKSIKFPNNAYLSTTDSKIVELMKNKTEGSIFAVFAKGNSTSISEKYILCFRDASGWTRYALGTSFGWESASNKILIGGRIVDQGNFGYLSDNNIINDETKFVYADVDHLASKFGMSVNGSSIIYSNTEIGTGPTANTNSSFVSIAGGGASDWFDGYINCILFFDKNLTLNERQQLEGWAAHKYGLTDNLPVDHPYKNRRPVIDHTPTNLTATFKND